MSMPAGPPPIRHDVDLGVILLELLRSLRAESVRLLDLQSGRVLAARTAWPVPADPAADAAMSRLAAAAFPAAASDGGVDDLVLATPLATHVLAPAPFRSVIAVRLAPGSHVGAARQAVTAPLLSVVLRAARSGAEPATPTPLHAVPDPRTAEPEPVLPAALAERQPALAALAVVPFRASTGELAARALGDLGPVPAEPAVAIPLPRRGAAPAAADGVASTRWSHDVATMRRLLDGLRRLA